MAYSIRLPDGTLVRNIPDELSPEEAKARILKAYPEYAPPSGALRQAADIPVQVGRGAVMGVRMLADTLGADNPVSNALRGAEDYLGDLLSAEAKKDQKEIARILKDAEDKGVLDQVKAGLEALTVAPVDLVSQVLGTAAPTIAAGMAGAAAKLGTFGIGALQAGTGAAMGAGLAKGNIYEVVKEELMAAKVPEDIAEERAKAAQAYTGENWDQIILGGALGGAAALGPLERIFARVPAISPQVAAKNIFARAGAAGVAEAVPEAAQAFQEQVAQNIALQREGFDVPTFRGAVANATLEGLAGFGIGAPIGALEGKPTAQQPPGQQQTEPTPPAAAPAEGIPLPAEEQLTAEEEAELQARIAATQLPPPPPAAPVAVEPTPMPPAPPAPAAVEPEPPIGPMPEVEEEPIVVPPTTEEVTQGLPVTPQTKSLTDQLAQVRAARMDPMLSPEDPAFLELDRREQEILGQIEQMTAAVQVGQVPTAPPPVEPSVQVGQVTPPPAAPVVAAPPVITPPVVTSAPVVAAPPAVTAPEVPAVRPKQEVQAEINRVRQSLNRAKAAVKKNQLPEAEVTNLESRLAALDEELEQAKTAPREIRYRSPEGNTWTGKGNPPTWLRQKMDAGFDMAEFEIRPELGNKSEAEVELEKPPGFGRRAPPTRPPEEYEALSRQIDQAETETPNLFTLLKGQLTDTEVNDISPEKSFSFLRAGKGKGTELSELVSSDTLVDYLPDELQPGAPTFDASEAAEYIKDLLRQDPATNPEARLSYYTREVLIPSLRQELDLLEQELEPEDVNQLIQEIVAEERAAIADIEAGVIAEQERGPAVPPVTDEFALTGQTPEELAEIQRRELSGEAEAERERLEAEEAARAAAEAERKIADQKRETFQLAPPPSAPAVTAAAPSGDLFGAAGIAEQPTRAPRRVGAELSPIEAAIEESVAQEAMGTPQEALDDLVKFLRIGSSETNVTYDPNEKTIVTEEVYSGETTIKRIQFDAVTSLANKIDGPRGARYSILLKDTPTEAVVLTFEPEGIKPLDRTVGIKYSLNESKKDVNVPPVEEEIATRMKQLGVDNLEKRSKEVQDFYGVSKPVADAYVRAVRKQAEAIAKISYGQAPSSDFQEAYDEAQKLLNRIKGISKRKEAKPEAEKKPSTKKTREVAVGTVVERIELPENLEIRIVKLKDGYSVYQYDLDGDQIVMGEQRQFRAPAFPKDQDAYRAAEAFADEMFDKAVPKQPEKMKAAMEERLSRGEDVVNNRTVDPDIPADQRLVLMSCCATKNKAMGMGPAMDVYTGVFFQTFKNKVKEGAMPNVRILSAKYGFIKPDQRIGIYDQVMDKAMADKFMVDDKLVEGFPSNIKDVLIVGSDQYQRVMKAAIEDLIKEGKIDKGASINVTKGGIGEQRAQLGKYLASLPSKAEARPVEVQTWDVFYTGTSNVAAENVEAPSAQKAKEIAAEKEGLKSIARLTAKKKEKRIVGPTETVTPSEDTYVGVNASGEKLYEREDGQRYRMRMDRADRPRGYPDFGGDLVPVKEEAKAKTPSNFYREMLPEAGFKRLEADDPRTYKNKAGEEFLTFERDGVRIAVKSNTQLYADARGVGMYMGEGNDLLLQAMIVDEDARQQGKATKAMQDILSLADQAGMTTYIEPVQMTKDVGMSTDQLKAFYKRFGFEPQKIEPTTDRVMVREPGAKIEAKPTKAEPAKFGPTITEIMAETEALRKKAAEMGIEIGTTYVPKPDTSKQEAKERKERQDLLRRVGESERIRGIGKEPIKGTAQQRSAAGRLANSVNGELLFLDGSRGLGLVLAKDKNGDDVYLPIHSGKISKVDVRDFTGLKTTDKNYLIEARRELLSTVAAKAQQKKEEDEGWEFMIEMTPKKQGDLFGSPTEAKEISQAMTEVKGKKLPPGRSPELTAAAQAVKAGTLTAAEYNKLVDTYKPIPLYAEPLKPATSEQVFDALDVKKREQINPDIPNGTKVGLRLDIPAFNRKGVFVVSIHQKRTASAPGKVIGYGSVAKAKNVTFGVGNQLKALEIAAGSAKDALQTMEGEYVNTTPEQAFAEAQRAIKDPNYVQIGIDPTRHAYFYDRRTTLPVVAAEEVIQIGNMILAKKPTFGSKADFLYNIEAGPIQDISRDADKRAIEVKEQTQDLKDIRREKVELPAKTADYGTTEEGQRIIASLTGLGSELSKDLDQQKPQVYTAENLLRQARKEVDNGNLSADVFAVLQSAYMDDPKILEGLRFEVTEKYSSEEIAQRRVDGLPIPMGAFKQADRLIHLYTGTKGVTDPMTLRHELTHTLEQMMTPQQRKAVINAYIDDLKKAAKKHKDARSQDFFDKVIKFLNEPFPANREAMNNAMPSVDFYQYTNPSEYWAVNAEKLMASRLGAPWDRFKKAIRKVFEKMKKIFGFNNRFVVHDVFDQIMSGSKDRMDRSMLSAFIQSSGEQYDFFESVEKDAELVRKYQRPDTPMLDHSPVRRMMVNAVSFAKDEFKNMAENPSDALRMMFNSLNRGVMYLRNKNIWFGSGINEADRIRYNGQVRTAEGLATASLALDNMLRGGNIATQALFLGGVEFNKKTLQYTAARKDKNMTKVYEAEARLKEKLGEQLGTNIIQGYLEAKRSRSIKDEVEVREMRVEFLAEQIDEAVLEMKRMDADPKTTKEAKDKADRELRKLFKEYRNEKISFENMKKLAEEKVTMSDIEIDEFIGREEAHPELREIIENFNAVNQNLLKFWREVGLLSDARYNALASIKDYVPWYRIMNDEEDVHSPLQATTRSATNIGREKLFKSGKPSVINDFIVEENQDVFRIQPSRVNAVKLNGVKLKPENYEATANGEVRLKVDYKPGDVVVIETQREIENMIDNMTRNVMRMTMNGLRQYAASRIVSEYATRDKKGQIMIFPKVDREKGRFDYIHDGRRYVVEIQDPLLAEAAYGMETVGMEMWKPLAAAANFTRRTITLSPVFQLKQVFKDAPTAALVTGVKRPDMLLGGVYKGFIDAVRDSDPAAGILRGAGIGGFYSPARTPEADVKRQIGIINNNTYDYVIKALDHWGDSSDMAQRIAIYNRVMKETGDEALAMYQAANIINFLRHGSGQLAQALVKTVPFLNAYAQSIDVLFNALVGGGLRGKDRTAALKQLAITGSLLAGTAILYTMLVGDDEDYQKLDDQTKVRNIIIPGTDVILPMNTSAAFFFKAIPELITNKIINEGTKNEIDAARMRTALKESAIDLLLGPTPIPSAVKPVIEISLDYNFFTSRPITPRGMENLDAYQQYDMRTSEAAKLLSGLTGTEANRLLNPMEADHLIRSIFGTAGAMVAWSSNVIGEGSAYRPEMTIKEMPVVGAFLRPEIPRGREDLFYRLKDATDRKYRTFQRIVERGDMAEADAYMKRYPNLIAFYDYTTDMANDLKDINAAIRYIGEVKDPSFTPERKRREIQQLMELKQSALEGIEQFRKEAYAD